MRQAAAADPKLTVRLCDMLVAADQADQAVAVCRQQLRNRPDDVDLRLALGRALSASGNLEEAQAALFDAVARKRRSTLQNVPTGAAGQNTPHPSRTPTPVFRDTPMPRMEAPDGAVPQPVPVTGTARQAVPSLLPSIGTARHASRAPSGVPVPVSHVGTSRHSLPPPLPHPVSNPLLELPRPRLSESPVPVSMGAAPSSGLHIDDDALPQKPDPVPVAPMPGPARWNPLSGPQSPAPPRKLPPLSPPSRRPFAPLPPSVPRFPGSPPRAELARPTPSGAAAEEGAGPQRGPQSSGLQRPPLPPPDPLPAELAEPILSISLPAPEEEISGEQSDQPSLAESVLQAAADAARSDSKLTLLPAREAASAQALAARFLDPESGRAVSPLPIASDDDPLVPPGPASGPAGEGKRPLAPEPPTVALSPEPTLIPALVDNQTNLPAPLFDLDQIAKRLLGGVRDHDAPVRLLPVPERDARAQMLFDRQRARVFTGLWIALVLVSVGVVVGWATRAATTATELKRQLARASRLAATARYEDDLNARDLYMQVLRLLPRDPRGAALAAEAEARLAADHGEGTDDSAFVLLRRAQQEVGRTRHPDVEALGAIRRATMLLSLARGEPCPLQKGDEETLSRQQDGDVAARCAWQRGDVAAARQILAEAGGGTVHQQLFRGALALSLGDLEEADHAYRTVLDRIPQHPRALLGQAMLRAEQGRDPLPFLPNNARLGLVTESWWYLMYGVKALQDGNDEAAAQALDRAQAGWSYDARLALAVGRARLSQGRVAEAEVGLRMAQRRSPSDPDLLVFDAEVAVAKGYEDRVVQQLMPLTSADPPPGPRLLSVLGRAQYRTGDYRAAAATLHRVTQVLPSDLAALSYEALCHARLQSETDAFHQLEVVASGPHPVTTPHYALAILSYERKDLERAFAEAQRALQHSPDAAYARTLLGRVLREQGRPGPAIEQLLRVTREAPSLVAPHRLLGRIYLDENRMRDARDEMLKVVQRGDPSIEDYMALLDATLALSLTAEAQQIIKEAGKAGAPAGKFTHANLVLQSLQGSQQAMIAARQLEAERKANPHEVTLTLTAAAAWLRAGDAQSALDDYEMARTRAPMPALLGIGRTQLRLRNLTEAEAAYRAAISQWTKAPYAPEDLTEARAGLARVLLLQGSVGEAKEVLGPALKDTPGSAEGQLVWAKILGDQGQKEKAREAAQRAADLDPANIEACVLLGDLTFKLKDQAHAKQCYQHCLTLNPSPTIAKYLHSALLMIR